MALTKKEQARFRAITSQIARMREQGFDRNTHPDFDILEAELAALGEKMTASPGFCINTMRRGGNRKSRRAADRNADRIDGYDRDDLGESPDF